MKILLISGFLGAGKTTFIKELVKRTATRPVIMENEYGENNIDALELQSSYSGEEKMQIMEFMEGCVCCTMKDSFVNSVLTVFSSLNPEYLIIEPTGVGKLSNILENLKPILHDNITLLKPVVVLSPDSLRQNLKEWPELYRNQVANAGRVVFSKCEHTDREFIQNAVREIEKINSNAEIADRHYHEMDDEWWKNIMEIENTGEIQDEGGEEGSFSQVSLTGISLSNPVELLILLEDCLHGEFGCVARAKGTIKIGREMVRFDLADRMYVLTAAMEEKSQCVFIGKFLNSSRIKSRLNYIDGQVRKRSSKIAEHLSPQK